VFFVGRRPVLPVENGTEARIELLDVNERESGDFGRLFLVRDTWNGVDCKATEPDIAAGTNARIDECALETI
jgi:hypothetical protein